MNIYTDRCIKRKATTTTCKLTPTSFTHRVYWIY